MSHFAPVSNQKWRKFLESQKCYYVRQSGDHLVYKKDGIRRPVIFRSRGDVPRLHIKTNLKTLGLSIRDFMSWLEKN